MSKGKWLAIVFVWLVLAGILAVSWRYIVKPRQDKAAEQAQKERLDSGSSDSRYKHRLKMRLDAFSGYAILRSQAFENELSDRSIKIAMEDDKADYAGRLNALKNREVDMAVFTIDALLKTSAQANDLPGSIVAIIDETRGADAIVGFSNKYSSVDDFNNPDVRFVLTPDSPSETLARYVMTHFDLPNMADDPIIAAKDAQDVYSQYLKAKPTDSKVFVLWEPYVSKMTENSDVRTIISTRNIYGYIVDVLVVNREFLRDHEDVVKEVVECYFRAHYKHRNKMTDLVFEDSRLPNNESLSRDQAGKLVEGVQWKDTQRNYAHFGIIKNRSIQHVEDMIDKITKVLLSTGAISSDPTGGKPNLLYYDAILKDLESEKFHPSGTYTEGDLDDAIQLRPLSESEWNSLSTVGTLKVPRLVFPRDSARLLGSSKVTLNELANTLRTQSYYLKIQGFAIGDESDEELKQTNLDRANDRAQAAVQYLTEKGIATERIHAMKPALGNRATVSFSLGQLPY